ncbi:T9SS type A sorting domain-containing protein [Flavobacterium sp. Sd200]|uniref:lamin tail domain-containing protein n=1 Tax=Flavobacterium sp. Sd200 TaxID=2692211 RepID=UPI00136CCEA9|nr:lamin tail domain-containing protein [Flavobacterium sp. Sd200]MXN92147.1 T9SS type A sorting domain-containing protein [Flavobacterium sp. Sd200]
MKKLYILAAALVSTASFSQVVISQVYGGGGNNGAVYSNDFVELFNRGSQAVTLTGHTLQYASNSGSFNASNIQPLPTITIQPGQYYLIQEAAGNTAVQALPTPDYAPVAPAVILSIGGTNGKIVLASNDTAVTSPTDANVVDFVGFGSATTFEGSGPTPALGNALAAVRASNGCQDTNDNATDFVSTTPTPRNTATPVNVCGTQSINKNQIAGLKLSPNPLTGNVLTVSSNSDVEKTVAIFDITGKQILSAVTVNNTVNAAKLSAGVYIVKVTEEGKTATKKLIVQ